MNLLIFVPGFIGALIGIVVYQIVILPLFFYLNLHVEIYRKAKQVKKFKRKYMKGMERTWAVWGTKQMPFNSLANSFNVESPYSDGINQALKDIWPFEEERRLRKYQRETS
jgi:hypothetical protein